MSSAESQRPQRKAYRAVIISPHLDDAVFSCAGTILSLVREGPVLVINVFTRYLSDLKSRAVVLSEERYGEESAAAAALGFESINLGELDAVFRQPAYRSIGNIFRPPVADDLAWLPALQVRLVTLLESLTFEALLVPLGVGWHVDHLLCFESFRHWRGQGQLRYYEDQPYALFAHATRLRLAETGALDPGRTALDRLPGSFVAAWWQTSMQYARSAMMRNLRPTVLRWAAQPVVACYLSRLMRAHWPRDQQAHAWQWCLEHPPLQVDPLAKAAAMAIYRSQFLEFFADEQECATMLRRHAGLAADGAAIERLWQRVPAR